MAVRLSTLRTGRALFRRNNPGTHFCWKLSKFQGHLAAERIIKMHAEFVLENLKGSYKLEDLREDWDKFKVHVKDNFEVMGWIFWHSVGTNGGFS
jgi:hypothetical protein